MNFLKNANSAAPTGECTFSPLLQGQYCIGGVWSRRFRLTHLGPCAKFFARDVEVAHSLGLCTHFCFFVCRDARF
jgi:hypothetical protein